MLVMYKRAHIEGHCVSGEDSSSPGDLESIYSFVCYRVVELETHPLYYLYTQSLPFVG